MDVFMENDKLISIYFSGILELMDYHVSGENGRKMKEQLKRTDRDFYGPTNPGGAREAVQHALLGDHDLMKILNPMISELENSTREQKSHTQKISVKKRKRVRCEFGDELDIHKVYQGEVMTAWSKMERKEFDARHKLVTLLVDIGGNANVPVQHSLWRAAVVCRMVSDLQKAGKSVRILVGSYSNSSYYGSHKRTTLCIVVKEYGQHLSIERLAAMCHLGFFRAFCFAAFFAQTKYTPNPSLGRHLSLDQNAIPLQIEKEVEAGHTKVVLVAESANKRGAVASLDSAYRQLGMLAAR